jgi:hypothetical protein
MATPRYWRVVFAESGAIESVTEIVGEHDADWIVVEGADQQEAERKALNRYFARKKRERIEQLHAQGQCRCGRAQDREGKVTCSVCAERRKADHQKAAERAGAATPPRDEAARIEMFKGRLQERKQTTRLEVLLEVRQRWIDAPNVGRFGAWLTAEIAALSGSSTEAA